MFESSRHHNQDPGVPTWLARDLGIHPSTRLASVPRGSNRGLRRLFRLERPARPEAVLATIPLFAGQTRKDRQLAAQLSTNVTMPAGAVLTREGAQGAEFFVLLDGEVDVVQGGEVIATRGPGSPLGEMALLEGGLRTATLVAKTPVSTLVSGRREFNSLLDAVPHVSERLHAITAERHAA